MKDYHRLLRRQLKKVKDNGSDTLSNTDLTEFLQMVNQAYIDYDRDFRHQGTILDQSSLELFRKNKELEEDLHNLFENSSVGIVLSVDGKFRNVNKEFRRMIGYSLEEFIRYIFQR